MKKGNKEKRGDKGKEENNFFLSLILVAKAA
jgi:hypothetical protein